MQQGFDNLPSSERQGGEGPKYLVPAAIKITYLPAASPAKSIKRVGRSYENDKFPTPLACLWHPDRVNQNGLKSTATQPRLKLAQRQDNLCSQPSRWSSNIVIFVRPTDPLYAFGWTRWLRGFHAMCDLEISPSKARSDQLDECTSAIDSLS